MGQSNFNKAAIKAKENGAADKSKLEPAHKAVLIVIGALLVAALIFATLVSTHVINCTNTSTMLNKDIDGDAMYVSTVTNKEGNGYENNFYVIDSNGKYIDCFFDEELQDVCYIDEDGNAKVYLFQAGSIGENAEGTALYMEYSANLMYGQGSAIYYFFDKDGNRVDCTANEDFTKVFYKDASGSDVEFVLVDPTSPSDVTPTDVTPSDVTPSDVTPSDVTPSDAE